MINIADYKTLSLFVEKGLNEDVVKNHYFFRSTYQFIKNSPPLSTYIVDFYDIERGMKSISAVVGVNIEMPLKNVSNSFSTLDVALDTKHISKIRTLYKEDIAMCGCMRKKHGVMTLSEFYDDQSRFRVSQ